MVGRKEFLIGRPNIIFYFSDQQRFDTYGAYGQPLPITPNLDALAAGEVVFEEVYSPQPVCGPCRALFQAGWYPTETGCFQNNIVLPDGYEMLADYFNEAGYETVYIGKWYLASTGNLEEKPEVDYTVTAVPPERRGGYKGFWRMADVLGFTSHDYDGYVSDENMNRCGFRGYRIDCITDLVLEYLDGHGGERLFFMTISYTEPHHQNDHKCYEGPVGSKERPSDYVLPGDLVVLKGNADEMYPDYLGCYKSLDDNLGRPIEKLKEKGLLENTVIVYVSDHGSHLVTRNQGEHLDGYDDYKRTCHSAALYVPLVIAGPGYGGGKRVKGLVSMVSLPKTFLAMARVDMGDATIGENFHKAVEGKAQGRDNAIFAQISGSRVGRCARTEHYLYSVHASGTSDGAQADSDVYVDDFLYDVKRDPYEFHNLIEESGYGEVREEMVELLVEETERAGEKVPEI